jgi:TetR/AcrR family transcriptional repressor of nem operon
MTVKLINKRPRGRETRERIVEEAVQRFSVNGYYHTSLDEVAQALGMTKGALFAHFSSKEALGHAAIQRAYEMWEAVVLPEIAKHEDPREKLRGAIEGSILTARQRLWRGGCFLLALATEMDDQHEEFRAALGRILDQWRGLLAGIVNEGKANGAFTQDVDADRIAHFIIAAIEGATMVAKTHNDLNLYVSILETLQRLLPTLLSASRPAQGGYPWSPSPASAS